ncbi:MAG: insulinase family protein [Saprospiraceae bacterium]|nr:insulinase family protein [Saprospiraceae bacterium]
MLNTLLYERVEEDWSRMQLPAFKSHALSNGCQLYAMQTNKPGLCFLELVFSNGRWTETTKLSARLSAQLIMEGTSGVKADAVADFIDFHGAHLAVQADLDFTFISLSCLQKHFGALLEFLCNLALDPAYRQEDLDRNRRFLHSQLKHQLSEPDYVSYREFTSLIYGVDTAYGYNTTPGLLDALCVEDLRSYHDANYCGNYLSAFYCGEMDESTFGHLERQLIRFPQRSLAEPAAQKVPTAAPAVARSHHPMKHSRQTSLKFGLRTFPRQHPDFFGMYLLNTVLGDYFGSRLMKNIREDKGLTYDIHSALDCQVHDGCFYISAELNPKELESALRLIRAELGLIREELIPEAERLMVRNYLCGSMLRLLDGPFQTVSFLKTLVNEYGSPAAFDQLKEEVLSTGPERLRELASKWLDPEKMILVTAGA